MKKLFNLKNVTFFAVLGLLFAGVATATINNTEISADAFDSFMDTVLSWAQGGLGIGLAVTCLLIGAGLGLMRSSPMPALGGIALGAFIAWGPGIIVTLVQNSQGAMIF